jgi:hypothetical protein
MIERCALEARATPRGIFGALIRCECGHGIGAHTRRGCNVGVYAGCVCRLSDDEAMARAIDHASTADFVEDVRESHRQVGTL